MGKVNVCVKRSYLTVTSLMLVVSALLLAITLFTHGLTHEREEVDLLTGLSTMYAVTITSLLLSITGLYGACKKKTWMLILFTVGMGLCTLFLVLNAIHALVIGYQIPQHLKEYYLEMLPLNETSTGAKDAIESLQTELHCCGLDQGYVEWGYNITESCLCPNNVTHSCVAAPINSSLYEHMGDGGPVMIYEEPCLPLLIWYTMLFLSIAIGISFGLALTWLLSLVLCIVMLCQLRQKKDTPTVVYSSEAKTGNYTVLTETADLT